MAKPLKIILVANNSRCTYQFRLGLIKALTAYGFEVIIVAPYDSYSSRLVAEGHNFIPLRLNRFGTNPLSEYRIFRQLLTIYRNQRPDFIFHYTIKPNLYGTLAASVAGLPSIAITTGLGRMLFSTNKLVNLYTHLAYRITGRLAKETWFLNEADKDYFVFNKLVTKKQARLLPSEGVNLRKYRPGLFPRNEDGITRFLFVGRMIKEKGLLEYVEAAKRIRAEGVSDVEFQIMGYIENENPSAIDIEQIEAWHKAGTIHFLGETRDVRPYIERADCVVLPSYREGVSRILLEAAAMATPIIASRVPGCKEVVQDRVSGFLVEPRNSQDLFLKINEFLSLSPGDQKAMGLVGRKKVAEEFSEERVVEVYFNVLNIHVGKRLKD